MEASSNHGPALADDTDSVTDAALAAADEAIDRVLSSPGCKRSWLRPVAEETSDGELEIPEVEIEELPSQTKRQSRSTLFYEMTETLDVAIAGDSDADFGLSPYALEHLQGHFSLNKPSVLNYELTEDLGAVLGEDWQDSDFGLADWQLEEVWANFSERIAGADALAEASPDDARSPAGGHGPCPREAETVEEVVENIEEAVTGTGCAGLQQLHDFLGDHTLEQFIGQKVPTSFPSGMRIWLLSSRKLDSQDWYLLKVTDQGRHRYFMKSYADFEELHAALQAATPAGRSLPVLPPKDFLGLKQLFMGPNFGSKRTQQVRSYIDQLMTQFLSPSQEQVLRIFFGPTAQGQVSPPATPASPPRWLGPRPQVARAQRDPCLEVWSI